ncbi:aldo-keto reductase family 1 member B7-like [Styela clava]
MMPVGASLISRFVLCIGARPLPACSLISCSSLLKSRFYHKMPAVPNATLLTGLKMPMVGLGTWKSKKGEVKAAVESAIDVGYRHIDCALVYQNENEVGEGVEVKLKEGKVKREDLFITSKIWNTFHNPKDVKPTLMDSLKSLRTDYLDLYLMHWPQGYVNGDKGLFPKDDNGKFIYSDDDYVDTWKELEKLQKEGLVKNIGVSNFNEYQINRIIKECSVVPAVNQVESHPYLTNELLLKFCKSKGIVLTAYSPLGSPDRPWAKPEEPVLLDDPKIKKIAERLGKTTAQIVLRYQVQRGAVVIPKSVTPSRIASNFQLFDFELTDDDMAVIGGFNKNFRGCGLEWISDHKYWPFKENYSE